MLSPLSFTIVVNVTKENARSVINKLPYADDLVIMSEIIEDLEGKMLKLEGCEGQHHKNKSDGKRVRKTVQKQDRSMWSLWEESKSQFSVVHEMWKLGSWQMCKNKKSYR